MNNINNIPYVIAVDFDGTLAVTEFPKIISPKLSTIEKAKKAQKDGAKVVLWTCRTGETLTEAIDFCNTHGLTFDAINDSVQEWKDFFGGDSRKIGANEYWDDRAVKIY